MLLTFVVKLSLISEEITRPVFLLQGNNKARVLFLRVFYDEVFFNLQKKNEGRHRHQNSRYQFQIAFETDQNCSCVLVTVHSLQVFLNY